jgi:hypothetical protein
VKTTLQRRSTVHDDLVWIGQGVDWQVVRRVAVLYHGVWYRYLTNELASQRLPALYVVALYRQRWRIEDAYAIVKRLLGLAYFWCGEKTRRGNAAMGNLAALCRGGRPDRCRGAEALEQHWPRCPWNSSATIRRGPSQE